MVDLGEDEERFDTFMVPLTTAFEYVGSQLANADKGGPWNETETKVWNLFVDIPCFVELYISCLGKGEGEEGGILTYVG